MHEQQSINYHRIAKAIDYIKTHFRDQPSLEIVAHEIGISPHHFQRIFTQWAGVSPKKFMQYLSLEYAKNLLRQKKTSLLSVAHETGFSGTGRLHDLFVNIERMTPGEFKNGGQALTINYSFSESPFGKMIIASTAKGVCHIFFEEEEEQALSDLIGRFPNAQYHPVTDKFHRDTLLIFQKSWNQLDKINLHLYGTAFQLKVWEALLKIPTGALTTYGAIAGNINTPKAARAVGTAIGCNPIAFLIPCHRVIKTTGDIGGYMWGSTRKSAIIAWEASILKE